MGRWPAGAAEHDIRDTVLRWSPLDVPMQDDRQPHEYQASGIGCLGRRRNRRGSIVLPTGAGKTFVAIHAIHRVNRSAVVVAPTIDLLHQWYALAGERLWHRDWRVL